MRPYCLALIALLLVACGGSGTRSSVAKTSLSASGDQVEAPAKPNTKIIRYRDPREMRGPMPLDPYADNPPQLPSHPVGGLRREGLLDLIITWSSMADRHLRDDVIARHGLVPADRDYGRMERFLATTSDSRRLFDRLLGEEAVDHVDIRQPKLAGN